MDTPQIKINGKIIQPASPKMKVWREFLAFFDKDKGKMTVEEFLSAHVALIVLAFNQPEVTKESVEDNLEIADVVPLARDLFEWLQAQTFAKLVNLPNGETEAGE
jgi:hypothetical protein